MISFKEFDLRDRAEIVRLAEICTEKLTAQPLIDYFHKKYLTRFENGKTIINKIIDKHIPNCTEVLRDDLHSVIFEFIFSFDGVQTDLESKDAIDEKNPLHDVFMAAKRMVYKDTYIPPNLRGKIEIYIKENGDVAITPKKTSKKEKLRSKFRDFFAFHCSANENSVSVDKYFDEWYDNRKKI